MALATTLPPARMLVAERKTLTLFIGYGGEVRFQQDSICSSCPEAGCLLLSPEACATENTLASAVALRLSPEQLLQTAMAMAGLAQIPACLEATAAAQPRLGAR